MSRLQRSTDGWGNDYERCPLMKSARDSKGLIAYWNAAILNYESHAIVPYVSALSGFAIYEALETAALSQSVDRRGNPVAPPTAARVWRAAHDTAGQPALRQFQLEGTQNVSVDFLLKRQDSRGQVRPDGRSEEEAREVLVTGEVEPARALARDWGSSPEQVSTLIELDDLTPEALGSLLALYEHKAAVLGALPRYQPV